MTMRNVPADIRSAHLSKTVQAMLLLHPDLPKTTKASINGAARAVRLMVEVEDLTGTAKALDTLEVMVKEAEIEWWSDRITSSAARLRQVI